MPVAQLFVPLHNLMMNADQLVKHIEKVVNEILTLKGLDSVSVSVDSLFLGDQIPWTRWTWP